jgi:tetratricopeptide (TPR) repeat protein
MRRFGVPLVPFAVSLLLSAFTVGGRVGWQDSGFFLAAVKDLGVLYPPGFVLYLVLCKTWTLLLGFVDFTLAVHLFSSLCAAGAAAAIAVAARELLRSEGPLFRLDVGANDLAAMAAGCLAASGYTFWSAALLAKPYALLYLVLSLLIWRMIRADATGAPRDYTIVAVLIGLAWAAHPSAVGVGLGLLLFVAASRGTLTPVGIVGRVAVAAAAAIVPSLLLPTLVARDPALLFGHPDSVGEWLHYLSGARFTGRSGVFGVDGFRVANAARYFGEEFLVVALGLSLLGLRRIGRSNRRLLLGLAAWTLPSVALAILFRIEGQEDFWLVSAWLPLYPAVAVGLAALPPKAVRWALPVLAIAGMASSAALNLKPVSMRGDSLAESYGRYHLEKVDRDAILMLSSDDALSTTLYLQAVKGLRPDVTIVDRSRVDSAEYQRYLLRRSPTMAGPVPLRVDDFIAANARKRPVYLEVPLREAGEETPEGPLLRVRAPDPTPRAWEFPVRLEDVRARFGRERGIRLELRPDGLTVEPEPYEQRWVTLIARCRAREAQAWFRKGGDENFRRASALYEEARAADPGRPDRDVVNGLATSSYLLKDYDRAEPQYQQLLLLKPTPRQAVRACKFLSNIYKARGQSAEAQRYLDRAMEIVKSDPELRREFDQYQQPR